jgi:outer membrane lipoprotein-sorting protein
MNKFSKVSLVSVLLILFFNVLAVTEVKSQVLKQILERIDIHQNYLFSLRSKVVMEKYNSQLEESDIIEGTVIYSRIDKNKYSVKIDWEKPFTESLTLVNGQYIIYSPRLSRAIVGNIDKTNNKVNGNLSFLTMTKKELKTNFNITYNGQETVKETSAWHLVLKPKKNDIYTSAEIWVDGNGMPIQVKVIEQNSDSTTVKLSDFKKNELINPVVFQLNLPKRTKIIKTSPGACACLKPFDVDDALKNRSDAVFSGRVIAVNGDDYTFNTERMWKDVIGNKVIVKNFSNEDSCSIKPVKGKRYVVFARKVNIEGQTVIGLMPCNMTSDLISESGKKTLKELGKGNPVKDVVVRKKNPSAKKMKTRRKIN